MALIKDTYRLLKLIIPKNLPLLLFVFVGIEITQHYFLSIETASRASQNEISTLIAAIGQGLTSLLEFVFLTMFVPLRVMEIEAGTSSPDSFSSFTKKHLGALTLEGLRSLAVILLWSLLLILPGVFKYLRLLFVPYVVVADPEYMAGRRDALEYSNALVKGKTLQIFFLLVLFLGIEVVRESARENFPLMQQPLFAIGLGAFFFAVSLFTNILLFRIYQLRVKAHTEPPGGTNGTDVQLAKN
jgi:uncharacterized membrane protein